jgi:hypothetical protein
MSNIELETLVLRRIGLTPILSLLMPTFAFVAAPQTLTDMLQRNYNAPLPLLLQGIQSFGKILYARLFSAQSHSTSELLRTL